jgi:hypothetical protein
MTRLPAILLLLGCLALPGCTALGQVLDGIGNAIGAGANRLTEKHVNDDAIHMAVAGPTAVDIESFGGHVEVIADPGVDHAVIEFTRRGLHGHGRTAYSADSLAEIDYSADVIPGDLGPILRIRTWTTHAEPYFQRADVRVTLPEVDGVHVRTTNGHVEMRDVRGTIDVVSDDGPVRLMTTRAITRPVTIINNGGDIDLRVRGESTGELDFQAVRGVVTHRVEFGEMIVLRGTTHNTLRAMFNGGDNPIVLRAADGDIRMTVTEAPTEVGSVIVQ